MTYVPEQLRAPRHPKYDAIHRALLTGLLSNIGTKGDGYEYTGARGVRFNIFPGSSLFEQKPKWLMAAELVETTKLYARTDAAIQPQWVERAAAHLVERTYSDPHWDPKTQSITAFERVALYGLVLIPHRPVHYGPINPKVSRELFIHHALVLEGLRTDAAFFRHNKALVEEVRGLEAKVRAHNLLADAATRYTFYDARLPQDVTNAAQLEAFRKHAERENPRLLFMDKADLLRADAPEVTPANYPDRTEVFGMRLPLDYKYEPGEVNDGITLTVPIAALSQLRPERYEWLVPGMLEEKVTALIKSLPGSLRRNFVPVPDFAKAAARDLLAQAGPDGVSDESLLEALAKHLSRMTGAEIVPAHFNIEALPDYLRMAFRVVDDSGRAVSLSRNLPDLQRKLAKEASHAFARIPRQEFNRDNITSWDFGDLPDVVRVQRFKMTIDAYPGLMEVPAAQPRPKAAEKDTPPLSPRHPPADRELELGDLRLHAPTVALRLFPSGEAARESHRAGLRRLFMTEQRREIKYMLNYLPDLQKAALYYLSLGTSEDLRDALVTLIVDRALIGDKPLIRTKAEWEERKREAVVNLLDTGDKVAALVYDILALFHQIRLRLEEGVPAKPQPPKPAGKAPLYTAALRTVAESEGRVPSLARADIHDQLVYLMPKTFMTATPYRWLEEYPRYLRGILSRLDKLANGNLDRDTAHTHEIAPWLSAYAARLEQHRAQAVHDPELDLFRWMLEEYRIHLFAQELHTPFPISAKRLEKQWAKVRQ